MQTFLKPLDAPRPVRVRMAADGRPLEIRSCTGRKTADRRAGSTVVAVRPVVAIREVWRIDDEWWRDPISRLYHEVVLENGKLVTLYLDLVDGGWWEQ